MAHGARSPPAFFAATAFGLLDQADRSQFPQVIARRPRVRVELSGEGSGRRPSVDSKSGEETCSEWMSEDAQCGWVELDGGCGNVHIVADSSMQRSCAQVLCNHGQGVPGGNCTGYSGAE